MDSNDKELVDRTKTFGELEPGDLIDSPDGIVEVGRVFDVHTPETMYEVVNENDETIKVSGNHLFYVESELDLASHHLRCKKGRRWVKTLPQETITLLEDWANDDDEIEIMLADFTDAIGVGRESEEAGMVARIAESVGPVSEINFQYDNILEAEGSDLYQGSVISAYDRAAMSQQVLSFLRSKKYPWKTIVGRVMETKKLAEMSGDYWIP